MRTSSAAARCGDRLGERARELVRLSLVQRGELLAGEIPLVEEEERLSPRRLPLVARFTAT